MPLRLRLAAHEFIVVNGAVLTNGEYRTTLIVRNFAQIMREKDVLQEEDATTPTRRLYFLVQAMLMQPPPPAELQANYEQVLTSLQAAYIKPATLAALDEAAALVASGDYYKALTKLQPLIQYEAALLNVTPHEWRRSSQRAAAERAPSPAWSANAERREVKPGRATLSLSREAALQE